MLPDQEWQIVIIMFLVLKSILLITDRDIFQILNSDVILSLENLHASWLLDKVSSL